MLNIIGHNENTISSLNETPLLTYYNVLKNKTKRNRRTIPSTGEDAEQPEPSHMWNSTAISETVSYTIKHTLYHKIQQSCSSALTKINETYTHIKTCTQMFIATSFIQAKTGNNPNVHQWVNG